jgi:hypothetical protein
MGIYTADGYIAITEVPGTSYTGIYAADGSFNVVFDHAGGVGVFHPCGAFRVNTNAGNGVYDSSGAYYYNHFFGRGIDPNDITPSDAPTMNFSVTTNSQLLAILEDF